MRRIQGDPEPLTGFVKALAPYRRLRRTFGLSICLLLFLCIPLYGIDRTIGQFVHTGWSAKDGAPSNIYALAQTTDGFLWLGTMQGLYRFDGVTFERYEPQSGAAFRSSFVTSLLALPNGDLWIGFRDKGGMSRLRDGRNTNYTTSDGLPSGTMARLTQDRDGAIWVASDGGLARFDHDRWQRIGNDWRYPGDKATALFVDPHGTLWVASENTILFLPRGSRKFQPTGIKIDQTYQIADSPGGTLWMAETARSVRPILFPAHTHGVEPEIQVGSISILFGDDGSLWIPTIGDGMRRVPYPDRLKGQKIGEFDHAIESFTAKDGLTGDYVMSILKDREGSIWVGTSAGLDRFRKGALVPIGLPAKFAMKTVVAGDTGDILVGSTSDALVRIEGSSWKGILPNRMILSGSRDSRGTVWLLGNDTNPSGTHVVRILRLEHGKPVLFATSPGIRDSWVDSVLAVDHSGTVWVGNGPHNLFFFKNGHWQRFETPPAMAGKWARAAFTDANGRVWFGFTDNTILVIDGANVRTFSAKDGLDIGSVMAITGREGHIWIGGENGLAVWEGNHFRTVIPADKDAFHGVSGIQEDSGGDLFLSEQRGVLFVSKSIVSKVLEDPSTPVQYQLFDLNDGLPGAIQETPPFPTSLQGTDGRIWFSASAGVAWIDPAHIPRNLLPPPVVIRAITANGVRHTSLASLKLTPRTRDLTIDYTALSLAIPERVRFRYKLEGQDRDWQDAGTRREAFYTNLDPGSYQFRVIACNNDGVWDETGTVLHFDVLPAFSQTVTFKVLCVVTLLAALWSLYLMRLKQITARIQQRLGAQLEERERIARELHDTLLQSFQGLLLRFQAASNLLPNRPDEAKKKLDHAITQTSEAIVEGRGAVQGLRSSPSASDDLADEIKTLGDELSGNMPGVKAPGFEVVVEGMPQTLHPVVRDEVYRIAAEGLRNAFQHAESNRIEVEIRYDAIRMRLRIRDDGKGIDPSRLDDRGRAGHWGLQGMRERAGLIGGHFEIWSDVGSGTEVELTLPSSVAYDERVSRRSADFQERHQR